jgi:hypothetical protein
MKPRALLGIALASVLTAACDLKPQTPETPAGAALPAAAVTAQPAAAVRAPIEVQPAPAADQGETERGIDRQRQTRV